MREDVFFHAYEINHKEEQELIVRLYKRFFYRSVIRKYGYLKASAKETPQICAVLLCQELEINPKLLPFFGIITTFRTDTMINWIQFVQILTVFLLRK